MENIITTISKFAPADISMDYERLRTEGIQHLEELPTCTLEIPPTHYRQTQ